MKLTTLITAAALSAAFVVAAPPPQVAAKQTTRYNVSEIISGTAKDGYHDCAGRTYAVNQPLILERSTTLVNCTFELGDDKPDLLTLIGLAEGTETEFRNCHFKGSPGKVGTKILLATSNVKGLRIIGGTFSGARDHLLIFNGGANLYSEGVVYNGQTCQRETVVVTPNHPWSTQADAKARGYNWGPNHRWVGGTNLTGSIGPLQARRTVIGNGTDTIQIPYGIFQSYTSGDTTHTVRTYSADKDSPDPLTGPGGLRCLMFGPGFDDRHDFQIIAHDKVAETYTVKVPPRWEKDEPIFRQGQEYGYYIDRPSKWVRNVIFNKNFFDARGSKSSCFSSYFVKGMRFSGNIFYGGGDYCWGSEHGEGIIFEDNIGLDSQRFGWNDLRSWDIFELVGYHRDVRIRGNSQGQFTFLTWGQPMRKILTDLTPRIDAGNMTPTPLLSVEWALAN